MVNKNLSTDVNTCLLVNMIFKDKENSKKNIIEKTTSEKSRIKKKGKNINKKHISQVANKN